MNSIEGDLFDRAVSVQLVLTALVTRMNANPECVSHAAFEEALHALETVDHLAVLMRPALEHAA